MKTQVINLLGGSGLGKSTIAAGLFYTLKMKSNRCELIREWCKAWAWEGRKIGQLDQAVIFGNQSYAESSLYSKVPTLITDSPLLLSAVYQEYYSGSSVIAPFIHSFLDVAKESGVEHHYFLLKRNKPFDPEGRYETEEQAKEVDKFVEQKLKEWNIPYTVVDCEDKDKVDFILERMKL